MAGEVVFVKEENVSECGSEEGNSNSAEILRDNVLQCKIEIEEDTSIKCESELERTRQWMRDMACINGLEIKPLYMNVLNSDNNISGNFLLDSTIGEHFLTGSKQSDYVCELCHKSFARKANLQRHALTHSRAKHPCPVCGKQFTSVSQRDKHAASHQQLHGLYPCDQCGKKFKSTSNLNQHKRVHSPDKPFVCLTCQRPFAIKANLVRHQTNTKCKPPSSAPIVCHVCHKHFDKEFLLRSHLRSHTTERPFQCDLCGLDFKHKSTIIRHLQWHNGARPHACKFCDKTFTHVGLLKPHLRVHTGEKPYQCSICKRYFAHKHNMERHKINHGRIKRLVCELCNKRFPRESRLIYHMRTHTNEKHFACQHCDKLFSHKQNILRHYSRKHPGATYSGRETDASVALRVWDRLKHSFQPHYDIYHQPEEILP